MENFKFYSGTVKIEIPPNKFNVRLSGPSGVGKTSLCCALEFAVRNVVSRHVVHRESRGCRVSVNFKELKLKIERGKTPTFLRVTKTDDGTVLVEKEAQEFIDNVFGIGTISSTSCSLLVESQQQLLLLKHVLEKRFPWVAAFDEPLHHVLEYSKHVRRQLDEARGEMKSIIDFVNLQKHTLNLNELFSAENSANNSGGNNCNEDERLIYQCQRVLSDVRKTFCTMTKNMEEDVLDLAKEDVLGKEDLDHLFEKVETRIKFLRGERDKLNAARKQYLADVDQKQKEISHLELEIFNLKKQKKDLICRLEKCRQENVVDRNVHENVSDSLLESVEKHFLHFQHFYEFFNNVTRFIQQTQKPMKDVFDTCRYFRQLLRMPSSLAEANVADHSPKLNQHVVSLFSFILNFQKVFQSPDDDSIFTFFRNFCEKIDTFLKQVVCFPFLALAENVLAKDDFVDFEKMTRNVSHYIVIIRKAEEQVSSLKEAIDFHLTKGSTLSDERLSQITQKFNMGLCPKCRSMLILTSQQTSSPLAKAEAEAEAEAEGEAEGDGEAEAEAKTAKKTALAKAKKTAKKTAPLVLSLLSDNFQEKCHVEFNLRTESWIFKEKKTLQCFSQNLNQIVSLFVSLKNLVKKNIEDENLEKRWTIFSTLGRKNAFPLTKTMISTWNSLIPDFPILAEIAKKDLPKNRSIFDNLSTQVFREIRCHKKEIESQKNLVSLLSDLIENIDQKLSIKETNLSIQKTRLSSLLTNQKNVLAENLADLADLAENDDNSAEKSKIEQMTQHLNQLTNIFSSSHYSRLLISMIEKFYACQSTIFEMQKQNSTLNDMREKLVNNRNRCFDSFLHLFNILLDDVCREIFSSADVNFNNNNTSVEQQQQQLLAEKQHGLTFTLRLEFPDSNSSSLAKTFLANSAKAKAKANDFIDAKHKCQNYRTVEKLQISIYRMPHSLVFDNDDVEDNNGVLDLALDLAKAKKEKAEEVEEEAKGAEEEEKAEKTKRAEEAEFPEKEVQSSSRSLNIFSTFLQKRRQQLNNSNETKKTTTNQLNQLKTTTTTTTTTGDDDDFLFEKCSIHELSNGEKTRLDLALRIVLAVVCQHKFFILDDLLSTLDKESAKKAVSTIKTFLSDQKVLFSWIVCHGLSNELFDFVLDFTKNK